MRTFTGPSGRVYRLTDPSPRVAHLIQKGLPSGDRIQQLRALLKQLEERPAQFRVTAPRKAVEMDPFQQPLYHDLRYDPQYARMARKWASE